MSLRSSFRDEGRDADFRYRQNEAFGQEEKRDGIPDQHLVRPWQAQHSAWGAAYISDRTAGTTWVVREDRERGRQTEQGAYLGGLTKEAEGEFDHFRTASHSRPRVNSL